MSRIDNELSTLEAVMNRTAKGGANELIAMSESAQNNGVGHMTANNK